MIELYLSEPESDQEFTLLINLSLRVENVVRSKTVKKYLKILICDPKDTSLSLKQKRDIEYLLSSKLHVYIDEIDFKIYIE